MSYTTEATRWRALVTRDPSADGHFFYSVKSTKIYCRPICPGRLARRANVGFYMTAFEAEAGGFRACKRCKPDTTLEDPQTEAVKKACQLINEALQCDDPKLFKLQELAKKVGLTPRYFHKIFKDKTGLTPKEYAKNSSSEHNSPGTTVASSTTEASVQTWDWNIFDFNDMVDYGPDPPQTSTIDFATDIAQVRLQDFGNSIIPNMPLEPWPTGYEYDAGYIATDIIPLDPATAATISMAEDAHKAMSTVSTFEFDPAALLSSPNPMNMFLT